eukprot:gene3403-5948_t
MQRVLKFAKQKSFVRSSSGVKKLDHPARVYFGADSEANRLTTDNIAKDFEAKYGSPSEYVKKADVDFQVLSKIKDILRYKPIESEEYFEIIKQAGGYETVEQVKAIYQDTSILDMPLPKVPSYTTKPFTEWPEKSELQQIDPKTLEKFYSLVSKSEKEEWEKLFRSVNNYEKAHHKLIETSLPTMDWEEAEKNLGEEKAFELREKFHHSLKNNQPTYAKNDVLKILQSFLKPEMDKLGDELSKFTGQVDKIGKVYRNTSELILFDHYSLPYQLNSYEYIDKYLPEVRDEILVEIEKGDFDYSYKERYKKLKHVQSVDDLWAKTEEARITSETFTTDKSSGRSGGQAEELNEFQQHLEVLYKQFQEQIQANKKMEMEISALKSKIEETRGAQRKVVSTTTKETKAEKVVKSDKTVSDEKWIEFFKLAGNTEEEILQSFENTKKREEERAKQLAAEAEARNK